MLLIDQEGLADLAIRAAQVGLATSVHAIGDQATHEVLGAFSTVRDYEAANKLPHLRHRIEHLQLLHPDDSGRAGALNLVASMQPVHATSDMPMADRYWGDRVRTAYAWRSELQAGAHLAFGSDAPVEDPNPFLGIHAAVTRRRVDGSPGPQGWVPDQRVTLEQALAAFTLGPAYAAGMESVQGRLEPGYLADLVVLARDPYDCRPDELAELTPVGTMVGGEWRFRDF
jgi:predicted amidohydrolase YtcJ